MDFWFLTMHPYHINSILFIPDMEVLQALYPDDWEVCFHSCDIHLNMEVPLDGFLYSSWEENQPEKLRADQCVISVRGNYAIVDEKCFSVV